MNFDKLIEIAKALQPEKHTEVRTFHVSFIFQKNKILSIGINNEKSHPTNLKNKLISEDGKDISSFKGTCSELSAFNKLRSNKNTNWRKLSLFNVRLDKRGEVRLSSCCKSCQKLVEFVGFRQVFFTDKEGNVAKQ